MKELEINSYIPDRTYAADTVYVYGVSGSNIVYRWPLAGGLDDPDTIRQTGATISGGVSISTIFAGSKFNLPDGEIYAVVRTHAVNHTYELHRSTDSGATFALVYTFEEGNLLLDRGLTIGYPNGNTLYAMVEYNGNRETDQRILTSTDGITWVQHQVWTTTGGAGVRPFKHIHLIQWNTYKNQFVISVGDDPVESALFLWDGVSAIPAVNVQTLIDTHGFTGAVGAEYRAIDIQITAKAFVWIADNENNLDAKKGIYRCTPQLTNLQKVDLGDARTAEDLSDSFGWTGLIVGDQYLITDSLFDTISDGREFISIYSADIDDFGPGKWREIARHHASQTGKTSGAKNVGFWESNGYIGLCVANQGGMTDAVGTSITRLSDKNWEDFIVGSEVTKNGMTFQQLHAPSICPVRFVNDSGSDSNNGETPANAWQTWNKVVVGGDVPYGAAVVLDSAALSHTLTTGFHNVAPPSGIPNPTIDEVLIDVVGRGLTDTVISYPDRSSPNVYGFYNDETTVHMAFKDFTLYDAEPDQGIAVRSNSQLHVLRCKLGDENSKRTGLRLGANARDSYAHCSQIVNDDTDDTNIYYTVDVSANWYAYSCLISGAYRCVHRRVDGLTTELHNCVFDKYAGGTAIFGNAGHATGSLKIRNSIFKSGDGVQLQFSVHADVLDDDGMNLYELKNGGSDLGSNTLIADYAEHFVGGEPRDGFLATSDLVGRGELNHLPAYNHTDSNGVAFLTYPSAGWVEITNYTVPDFGDAKKSGAPPTGIIGTMIG